MNLRKRNREADSEAGELVAPGRQSNLGRELQLQVSSPCRFSSSTSNVSAVCSPRPATQQAWAASQARAVDTCSLLSCSQQIESSGARASIRIAPADAKRCRDPKTVDPQAQIAWKRDGTATFHKDCYDAIKKSVSVKEPSVAFGKFEKGKVKDALAQTEIFDSEEEIVTKAHQLADELQTAKHVCVFSGAGLSTAAGIGDYRGLKGKWTEEGMGEDAAVEGEEEDADGVQYENLRPTLAHEGISYLVSQGLIKYVISQNCDGLHLLSGVPKEKLSELHGNVFLEYCEKCGKEYERDHYVCFDNDLYYEELADHGRTKLKKPSGTAQCKTCGLNHRTTRKCDDKACKGWLRDTIINFGDDLRDHIWDPAEQHADQADVMLCFGSTLEVTPACHLAEGPSRKRTSRANKAGASAPARKLAIVNRQQTPLDRQSEQAGLRVHGDCDVAMRHVLLRLMGEQRFREWVAECEAKRKEYDSKRQRT